MNYGLQRNYPALRGQLFAKLKKWEDDAKVQSSGLRGVFDIALLVPLSSTPAPVRQSKESVDIAMSTKDSASHVDNDDDGENILL